MICAEPPETVLTRLYDVEPMASPGVRVIVAHAIVNLGRQKDTVPSPVRRKRAARDLLADAAAVHICRVEEVDAIVHGAMHNADGVLFARAGIDVAPVHAA